MPYVTKDGTPESSILKMERIVFDEVSFIREGFRNDSINSELPLNFKVSIRNIGNNYYRVSLGVLVTKTDEYNAKVVISGFCSIDRNELLVEELLKKNAVAILLPYVRSELTLLTAQPDTDPIVLPPINVNGLIDNMDVEIDNSEAT